MNLVEVDVIKTSKIVGGIAASIVAAGVIYSTTVDAWTNAHADFVTVGALVEAFDDQRAAGVKKFIRRLEWQQDNGGLTPQQQWELSDAYDELEDLQ